MPGVFISYRRDDSSGYAGRLFDVLAGSFGPEQTFMDLDDIQGGDDFTAVIGEKVSQCSVLLAIIGDRWLTLTGADGIRRLDAPGDFVRLEIAKALERGVRVIPVLVSGAVMPRPEDLPEVLRPLSVHQAVEVRDAHFHADAEQLIDLLQKTVPDLGARARRAPRWLIPAAAVLLLVAGAATLAGVRYRRSTNAAADAAKVQAAAASVAGTWSGTVKYDWGDSHAETFRFEIDGRELSGTASFLGYDRGIMDGKLEGNRISFTTKTITSINDRSYEDKHLYKGTVQGEAINFTMMTDSGAESHVPVSFTVRR
jgi:TIR domain-containing protein